MDGQALREDLNPYNPYKPYSPPSSSLTTLIRFNMTTESVIELFYFQVSALVLLNYDVQQSIKLLSLGRFCINLIMHVSCPILATVCCVDKFQWPLTKDTVVVRIAKRTFGIAMPGLLYGLQFPKGDEGDIDDMERFFVHFSHYTNINDKGQGYPVDDCEPHMWNKLRARVEHLAHETLTRLGQWAGSSPYCIPNQNSCLLRAFRMSSITKMVVESIHAKTLTNNFINIRGTNPPYAHPNRAYASVSVFSCIVDGIEFAWVVSSGLQHMLTNNHYNGESLKCASTQDIGFRLWRLNEEAMMTFMIKLDPVAGEVENIKSKINEEKKEEAEASASAKEKGKQIMS